jgi:hypothetical protein
MNAQHRATLVLVILFFRIIQFYSTRHKRGSQQKRNKQNKPSLHGYEIPANSVLIQPSGS